MDEQPEGSLFAVLFTTALIGGIVMILIAVFKLINTITL
jgi:hypothetical protein